MICLHLDNYHRCSCLDNLVYVDEHAFQRKMYLRQCTHILLHPKLNVSATQKVYTERGHTIYGFAEATQRSRSVNRHLIALTSFHPPDPYGHALGNRSWGSGSSGRSFWCSGSSSCICSSQSMTASLPCVSSPLPPRCLCGARRRPLRTA